MNSVLNQSKQSFRAIGLVNELNLIREDCEIKVKDKNGENKIVDGERIRGKIGIRLNNGVKTFDVFCSSITSKGTESKQWKNALSMLELNPEIDGDSTRSPSLVSVNGRISENSYFNENINEVTTVLRWNATRVSTSKVNADDEHGCTLSGNFFINNIKNETKDDNETGRLIVQLCAVGYDASPIVIEAIVDEDMADDFLEVYEVGNTANFDIDVCVEHVGSIKATGKKAFGKSGSVDTTSGYNREYLCIVGGDEAIEEPDETEDDDGNVVLVDNGWINPKAMKTALKEREKSIAELRSNHNTTTRSSHSSLAQKKQSREKAKASASVEEDPFDFDDDDF